jgi:hypothetical protein
MADIISRIRKLIELSKNNSSAEEAAQAAARAQELMFKYQIGEADLDVSFSEREVEEVMDTDVHVEKKGKLDMWKASLANGIANSFGARVYIWRSTNDCKYRIVALKSVAQTVSYMFGYLALEINRLADEAWKREKSNYPMISARTWKNSFRLGAVATIVKRLNEQRMAQERVVKEMMTKEREEVKTSTALALYKTDQERQEEAYQKVERERKLRKVVSNARHNYSAFDRGREAGSSVALGAKGGGLPAAKQQTED